MPVPASSAEQTSSEPRSRLRVLATACLAHITQDGLTDMLYVFFPVWQQLFALSFTEVGLLKGLFSGTLASFQIPAGALGGRIGVRAALTWGGLLTGLALFAASYATAPLALWVLLVVGGLGASPQHPLASAAIAQAYAGKGSRAALSAYNFAGDVGKLCFPALAALLIARLDWSASLRVMSLCGVVAAGVIYVLLRLPGFGPSHAEAAKRADAAQAGDKAGLGMPFWSMTAIGVLDSATRMGFLTFLPFVLRDKGAEMTTLGLALGLIFAGGATGKLLCGLLAGRMGILRSVILTETATAVMILLAVVSPLWMTLCLCPLLGVVLNGTSSILYGSVPELVRPQDQKRAFARFYTGTIGAGAVSPLVYGALSDWLGVDDSVKLVALMILLVVPLTWPLRGRLKG